jgi:hypothetical protein
MLVEPQGHSKAGRIMSMKISIETSRNQTRDLPAYSAVPQPTSSPRAREECLVKNTPRPLYPSEWDMVTIAQEIKLGFKVGPEGGRKFSPHRCSNYKRSNI